MNITRWNPFREMEQLMRPDTAFWSFKTPELFSHNGEWRPSVDITEDEKEFLIKAELPEVKKEDVKVEIEHGMLTLSGERKYENKDEKEHRMERFHGSFTRSFALPENVDEGEIKAESKDGMLYLHLPKTEKAEAKKVEVKVK